MLDPQGIYERNDAPVRELEGLEQRTRPPLGRVSIRTWWIEENGLQMQIDVAERAEDGLLSRPARQPARPSGPMRRGARVLDCFCQRGRLRPERRGRRGAERAGRGLVGGGAGAWPPERRAQRHERSAISTEAGNAFDVLRRLDGEQRAFDLVILDPPAFAKNRAARGRRAARLQGDQPARPAHDPRRRLPRHLLLLVPHDARPVPRRGGRGRRSTPAAACAWSKSAASTWTTPSWSATTRATISNA